MVWCLLLGQMHLGGFLILACRINVDTMMDNFKNGSYDIAHVAMRDHRTHRCGASERLTEYKPGELARVGGWVGVLKPRVAREPKKMRPCFTELYVNNVIGYGMGALDLVPRTTPGRAKHVHLC